MKKIFKFTFMCMFVTSAIFAKDATIEIVKKIESAPKILLEDGTDSSFDNTFKSRFFKMLVGDLKVTTHFNVIDKYVKSDYDKDPIVNVGDKKPNLILQYKLEHGDGGVVLAKIKFANAVTGEIRSERNFSVSNRSLYPFLSHNIVSNINNNIGANPIPWMNRYVLVSKTVGAKKSVIVVADYTLTYQKVVVEGGLNIFPKWANQEQSAFYFTSFSDKEPTLYKVYTKSGRKEKIISSQGMLVTSDVSKSGKYLLLTMAPKGQPDIYLYNTLTKNTKQVTFYKGIDVNGGFVDNEKRIVFVSDRLGYPNIFSKGINKRGVEQLVYHGRNNVSCSSNGNYIVYSSRDKGGEFGPGTFNLYLISTKTDYIRQLTATGKNLFPRFSQNGKSVMFIKSYGAQSALGLIRLDENEIFHFPLRVGKIQSIDW